MLTMKKSTMAYALIGLLVLILVPFDTPEKPQSQEAGTGQGVRTGVAQAVPVPSTSLSWSEQVPELSAEQRSRLDYWTDHTHLSGPMRPGASLEALSEGNTLVEEDYFSANKAMESMPSASLEEDGWLTRKALFGSIIPSGFTSNVMESSLGQVDQSIFFTGNWFAAHSTDGGLNWKYVTPFVDMPDFCCDQVSISDESRDAIFWLRMGRPDNIYENRFRLGVSIDGGSSFCSFDFFPDDTNAAWDGQWWDYPHIQLGNDSLYLAWNMFNSLSQWTRTVMLRLPLDGLLTCVEFDYDYVYTSSWFTFLPVQGADDTMWFASNWPIAAPFNRLGIWRWEEASPEPVFFPRTVTPWSYTRRGEAICGGILGNWAARTDDRLLAGSRFVYTSLYPTRPVLGFWWNVKQGGAFTHPYIEGAAFFKDDLTQVPGSQGRPFIFNDSTCLLYPAAAANPDGRLALVFHIGYGLNLSPAIAYTVADSVSGPPPGFIYFLVQASNARPADNKWGDYNTVRWLPSSPHTWSAGSHYINKANDCITCSAPVFFTFQRSQVYQYYFPLYRR